MKAFLYRVCAIFFSHFVLYPDYRISFFIPLAFRFADYRGTRMVKLEDINFTKVKDKEILAIDFTNTVTKIQVKKGDNIGFITEDGRKGIMNIAGASGRYIDFKCKTQTIPQ